MIPPKTVINSNIAITAEVTAIGIPVASRNASEIVYVAAAGINTAKATPKTTAINVPYAFQPRPRSAQ